MAVRNVTNAANQRLFMEDSDTDSIATDSTAESELKDDYPVDRILAEQEFEGSDGVEPHWLIRWLGYPDHRNTWEPFENIQSDDLFREWAKQKRLQQQGKAEPYDLQAYDALIARSLEEKEERRRRRRAKRKRKRNGLAALTSDEDGKVHSDGELCRGPNRQVLDLPKRKRTSKRDSADSTTNGADNTERKKAPNTPLPLRKGVARKITNRLPSDTDEDDAKLADDGTPDSEPDSLFDDVTEIQRPEPQQTPKQSKPSRLPSSIAKTSLLPEIAPSGRRVLPTTSAPTAATKSVPQPASKPVGTAKRTTNIFASFGDVKQRRRRPRVSGETPKDSDILKFRNLSTQNRFQKYSRNEKAPDLNALTIIDPKTGVAEPSRVAPSAIAASASTPARKGPQGIHSAYGRARSPSWSERRKSLTPPSGPIPPQSAPFSPGKPQQQPTSSHSPPVRKPPGFRPKVVCWHWLNGDCRAPAGQCSFAHEPIDPKDHMSKFLPNEQQHSPPPPDLASQQLGLGAPQGPRPPTSEVTCFFWLRGKCRFSAEECNFAHRDTGVYATNEAVKASMMRHVQCKDITCYYWQQGSCTKPDDQCEFAHQWMPQLASQPGTFKKGFVLLPSAQAPATEAGIMLNAMSPSRTPDGMAVDGEQQKDNIPFPPTKSLPPQPVEPLSATWEKPERLVRFDVPEEVASLPKTVAIETGVLPATLQIVSAGTGSSMTIYAELHTSYTSAFERIFYPIKKGIYLMLDRMVTAKDVEVWLAQLVAEEGEWPAGSIVPKQNSLPDAAKLAECGKLFGSGFVSLQDLFTLVVYPSGHDDWRFFDVPHVPSAANASLRFRLLPPLSSIPPTLASEGVDSTTSLELSASVVVANQLLGLNHERILVEKEGRPADTEVFLAWPEERGAELHVLANYFQSLQCKVYTSDTRGAWSYFRHNRQDNDRGLIIVHPTTPFWVMSSLHKYLTRCGRVRVFSIGVQRTLYMQPDDPANFSCERLFPHGKVTFITDDVFVYHPEKASEVIRTFLDLHKDKPPGGELDKIAVRPGIKDWLQGLMVEKLTDRGRQDDRYVQVYLDICRLCPPEGEDPFNPPNPLASSQLVSFPPEEMPSFQGLWDRDEEAATGCIVDWFAGWAAVNAQKFRRFLVCHEPKKKVTEMEIDENGRSRVKVVADTKGWEKRWCHIGVPTPDMAVKEMLARKKSTQ
ncbi:hypothetical protein BAUCODRAFT_24435 [Baudoinia panamericana UAMH 10762]|uniref:Chromo domain-containing protein n=1 Tax=Baudoinia panamericana (strain UAMH 10762) TaxID=717646 RepID=M2NCS9_BAUPA|nr:uncharacterized protein BAUCODRAFT_24435 [Baudoinia panamericana UAMH 10762]EMC96720.1 hypothetical protein BAUCODRAFT_24435 [Baudoinia panamericana UAMH 10762]